MPHIHANGAELYYEEYGEGDPLIVVHGGWSDHHNWQAVVPALAESFRVVAYDRRGHSQSRNPADHGPRRCQEDDLAALIEALECKPAHLAANSYGASIALSLAGRRPDLVRSVFAHEPPLMSLLADDPREQPRVQQLEATLQAVGGHLQRGDFEGGARQFVEEVALGPGAWAQLPAEFREIAMDNAPTFLATLRDARWGEIDLPTLDMYPGPVLLTEGDQSPSWLIEITRRLASAVEHAELRTFPGAGHVPHITNPDDYVAMAGDFARRAAPAPLPA
jgi:pimeloyl-ACP methyl ester carboxylesterase